MTGTLARQLMPWNSALAVTIPVAAMAGAAVALSGAPLATAAGAAGALVVVLVFLNPASATWVWLLVGPLIVGVARGGGLGLLRPNEALLAAIAVGAGLGLLWRAWRGPRLLPPFSPVDLAVLILVVAGSIMPLLLRVGRGLPVSQDDILYSLVLAKYGLLFALVRFTIRTPDEVATSLRLALAAGAVVAIVGLLQAHDIGGITSLLSRYYDSPFEGSIGATSSRATSTIASSFGLADMMAMCLAIVAAWQLKGRGERILLTAASGTFFAACLAAGSFSGAIGCVVAISVVGLLRGRFVQFAGALAAAALAGALALWPVVEARLAGFAGRIPLPHSWLGRIENLQRFFWPELFSGTNWLTGVRPAARVPAPEAWRNWVYIESGYTWLLWTGGVALVAAFVFFVLLVARELMRIMRTTQGPVETAAASGLAALLMIATLMLFDPHLTVRGAADLFFPLLALAVVAAKKTEEDRSTA